MLRCVHVGRQGTVKSGKQRHVPILDTRLPFMRELALERDGAVLVFPGRAGKSRTKPGVWYPFKMAAKRAHMPKLRVHDLRHTFARHWVIDGGDIFRLSKILGHSSVVVTQRVYAHLVPEAREQDYHRQDEEVRARAEAPVAPRAPASRTSVHGRGQPGQQLLEHVVARLEHVAERAGVGVEGLLPERVPRGLQDLPEGLGLVAIELELHAPIRVHRAFPAGQRAAAPRSWEVVICAPTITIRPPTARPGTAMPRTGVMPPAVARNCQIGDASSVPT